MRAGCSQRTYLCVHGRRRAIQQLSQARIALEAAVLGLWLPDLAAGIEMRWAKTSSASDVLPMGPRVERKEHAYYAIRPLLVAAVGPPPVQVALQRLRSFAKEDRPRHRPLEESSRRLDTGSLGIGSATDHLQAHIVAETPRGLT